MNAPAEIALSRQRLHPFSPLALDARACLSLRLHHGECNRCVEACPAGVLSLAEDVIVQQPDCLGCGRCAAACPTGALAADGFALTDILDGQVDTVYVDCYRVSASSSPSAAVLVPCLGGLSLSGLLELYLKAADRPLVLLDRGWCSDCPAGGTAKHPAEAVLSEARRWLSELAVPEAEQPCLSRAPLPRTLQHSEIGQARYARRVSRRGFFKQVGGEVAVAATAVTSENEPAESRDTRQPMRAIERERRHDLLQEIARRRGQTMPGRFFPAARIEAGCKYHGLCAAICPTGALRRERVDSDAQIVFEAAHCIACGQCEQVCPEQAFRLAPEGRGAVYRRREILSRQTLQCCDECGREFFEPGQDTLCLSCRRSHDFARDAYDTLFGTAATGSDQAN